MKVEEAVFVKLQNQGCHKLSSQRSYWKTTGSFAGQLILNVCEPESAFEQNTTFVNNDRCSVKAVEVMK